MIKRPNLKYGTLADKKFNDLYLLIFIEDPLLQY